MDLYAEIFIQAWQHIRAYALRSALTALGIVISVAGVIAITGVMAGLEAGVNRELANLGAENITVSGNWRKLMAGSKVAELTRRDLQALQTYVAGISTVTATESVRVGKVQFAEKKIALSVVAASAALPQMYQQFPEQGRFLSDGDDELHRRVCVVSQHALPLLGLAANPIGERLKVGNVWMQIVGVMPGNGRASGSVKQLGDLYIPLSVAEELTGEQSNLEFGFKLLGTHKREEVLSKVSQVLRQSQRAQPGEEDDFRIEDAAEVRRTNDAIIGMISIVLILIVSVSLVVGGIGIMNVMLVAVTERTKEIGILRALGATKQQIRVQFLLEAALLSGAGAVAGVVLGWLAASLATLFIPHADGAHLPLWAVASSVACAIAVGLVSGALPAARAAELDPVTALTTE